MNIDGKDLALLAVAGYVAVMVLVRMMQGYRDQLVTRFRDDLQKEKEQQRHAARRAPAEPQRRAG